MDVKSLVQNKQFLSLAGNLVNAVLNILIAAVLYRHLPKTDVGCWFFFQTAFILIDTFRTGFLQTAFIKFYAGAEKERADNILGSTWYLSLIITGIVVLINIPAFFLLGSVHDLSIIILIKWISICFISTLPMVVATWILQAEHSFGKILFIRLLNQGLLMIFIIICIALDMINIDWVLISNFSACAISSLVVLFCGWTGIRALPKFRRTAVKEIYHFGKFSVGTSISSNLLRSSDTFIINFTLGSASVAIYNIAQSLMNIIDVPLRSFVATAMSSLSRAQNNNRKEEVEYILKKYAGALTLVFIPVAIGAVIFADVAVSFLGGGKYVGTPAANIFRIFMIFAIFFPIDRFTGVTLDVIHQPKYNFYKVLTMLIINIAGDFAGIYLLHNIYGVGIASIPTFIIGTLFGYLSLKKFLNFSLRSMLKLGYDELIILAKMALSKVKR